jgi:hypothetical protein
LKRRFELGDHLELVAVRLEVAALAEVPVPLERAGEFGRRILLVQPLDLRGDLGGIDHSGRALPKAGRLGVERALVECERGLAHDSESVGCPWTMRAMSSAAPANSIVVTPSWMRSMRALG